MRHDCRREKVSVPHEDTDGQQNVVHPSSSPFFIFRLRFGAATLLLIYFSFAQKKVHGSRRSHEPNFLKQIVQ